jgi:hypothetical protein
LITLSARIPEPKQEPPETTTGEVVPFPTERDLVKPERPGPAALTGTATAFARWRNYGAFYYP